MKILVTGGAGFIGSNVVDGYVNAGHDVLVVDNLLTGDRSNIHSRARFFEMDIRAPDIIDLMKREKPEVLNHHAAQISVPESVADPVSDADINILGFLNLMEGAVRNDIRKVIFISSGGAVYGEAPEYPTSEACSPVPLSPYAVSKYTSEHYLEYYRDRYALDYTTLRYANIYGPRQVPHGEAGVVAIFMDNLIQGRPSVLNCFSEDPEGMVRDYCYVGDVVRANINALERGSCDYFNIGTGIGTKTRVLYQTIYDAFSQESAGPARETLAEPRVVPARAGDLSRSCLKVDKARDGLGWQSEMDLDEGIRKTLTWRLGRKG